MMAPTKIRAKQKKKCNTRKHIYITGKPDGIKILNKYYAFQCIDL